MNEVVGRGRCYDDQLGTVFQPRHSGGDDRQINIHLHTTDQGHEGIHGVDLPQGSEPIDDRRRDRHRDAQRRAYRRRDDYERARDAIDNMKLSDAARRRLHDAIDEEEEAEERRAREEEERREDERHRDEGREGHGYSIERDRDRKLRLRSDEPIGMNYGDLPETDKRRDRRPSRDAASIGAGRASARIADHPDIAQAYANVDRQAREEMKRLLGR